MSAVHARRDAEEEEQREEAARVILMTDGYTAVNFNKGGGKGRRERKIEKNRISLVERKRNERAARPLFYDRKASLSSAISA